jgi:hypothetical protein
VPTPTPTAERFHAYLLPSEDAPPVLEEGPIKPGPCARPIENCVTFEVTGSFTVSVRLVRLPPGVATTLTIPVQGPAGASPGTRSLVCPPADPGGRAVCGGVVAGAGIVPRLGGLVELTGAAPGPTATPTPTAPSLNAVLLPAGLAPLLPPPPVLLPPPPAPAALPPFAAAPPPEVPVIPEASSLALLAGGLAAIGAGGWLRRRARWRLDATTMPLAPLARVAPRRLAAAPRVAYDRALGPGHRRAAGRAWLTPPRWREWLGPRR